VGYSLWILNRLEEIPITRITEKHERTDETSRASDAAEQGLNHCGGRLPSKV